MLESTFRSPVSEAGESAWRYNLPMTAKKFLITLFQDEDGIFIAECPSIPGCVSQGQTASEAEANIQDAIRECLIVCAQTGMAQPAGATTGA